MHAGKTIVFSKVNAVMFPIVGGYRVTPRKRWLWILPSTLPGTIGALWENHQILSGEAYAWEDDKRQTAYRYDNPYHADNFAIQRMELVPGPDIGLSNEMYYMQHLTFWQGSTKVAEDSRPTEALSVVGNIGFWNMPIGPTWTYRLSVATWNTMSTRSRCSGWVDQPDYRPYDPRP